eukprot:m.72387 g.72387  ORF g.72387 m.72387 type:complete len:211 (+) comp35799_c0_seq2:1961-2593(+)
MKRMLHASYRQGNGGCGWQPFCRWCIESWLCVQRPFSFSLRASDRDMLSAVKMPVNLSSFESETRDLLSKLLSVEPGAREEHILNIRSHSYFSTINWDRVLAKQIKPSFVPGKDTVNADPCLELEELLLETRPLHKKKSRLKKLERANSSDLSSKSAKKPNFCCRKPQQLDSDGPRCASEETTRRKRLSDEFTAFNRQESMCFSVSNSED